MVLTKELDTNMTAYNMVSLYGEKDSEIYGTDGTEYNTTTAFVFASNARLTIQELNNGVPGDVVHDINQTLLDGTISDGPGKFGAEVTVAGNLAYGFVWDLNTLPVTDGRYRITFSLDSNSVPTGTPNNTFIDVLAQPDEGHADANATYVSPTEVYIDITINP